MSAAAPKPDPVFVADLKARLGEDAYKRRLFREDAREDEFHAFLSSKFTFFKRILVRPMQRAFLRALGLYGKGRREFLSPQVRENAVHLGARLPAEFDGFRILHLSDLHIDLDGSLVNVLSQVVMSYEYDICVMTGDYRNKTVGHYEKAVELMLRLRRAIAADAYLALGNHDFIGCVPLLEQGGYRVLLNECVSIRRGSSEIALAGVDDPVIFKTDDLGKALAGISGETVKVLLAHSPRIAREAAALGVDLALVGHTHGGQICLPGGVALIGNDPSPKSLHKGPWKVGRLQGYTTCGCGASGLPIRLNCPPEVVLHRLCR